MIIQPTDELWLIDALIFFLKNGLLVKLVRGDVLCSVWLARNRLCFQEVQSTNPRSIRAQILSSREEDLGFESYFV